MSTMSQPITQPQIRIRPVCRWCDGEGKAVRASRLHPGQPAIAACSQCGGKGRQAA